MLTRITDRKIPYVFIHVYCIPKNWGPGPYNSLRHADNTRYFSGLSLTRNRRKAHMFYLAREVRKFEYVLAEKKVTLSWLMNFNMVKPEKLDHFHLFYHFTVPLKCVICFIKSPLKIMKNAFYLKSPFRSQDI